MKKTHKARIHEMFRELEGRQPSFMRTALLDVLRHLLSSHVNATSLSAWSRKYRKELDKLAELVYANKV